LSRMQVPRRAGLIRSLQSRRAPRSPARLCTCAPRMAQ
jgi:hypothetical protein